MLGLKTQENDKFNRFWKIVQKSAGDLDKVFFADCGEGNIFETSELECEDMRGWLIPKVLEDKFKKEWEKDDISDIWVDYIFWAEWKQIGDKIEVEFKTY